MMPSDIKLGRNKHIKIEKTKEDTKWSLPYPGEKDTTNHGFYQGLELTDINDLFHFVNEKCQFMKSFVSILGRYARNETDTQSLIASLTAFGCNLGLHKMAGSSDLPFDSLKSTSDKFIRLETLKEANDKISNASSKLAIFRHYNTNDNTIHSSSDGQKFGTRIDTFNSRHSSKYFGLGKGVTSYTMIANHIPVNARIIGANEHESHYVFDLLFNNTSEIEPAVHSTDTHGTNEINFALLHFFGYQFAPRYKNLSSKKKLIYGFKSLKHYEKGFLKPIRKLKTSLIKKEWDNILRIIVSLALKKTTQSIIVGKLASHKRKSDLQKALWEFDNIIKSIYILDYIDDVDLRKNVQKALNRGESYHQLRRAIPYANDGKFIVKTELEQQIWSDCARLIANCIIFYNMYMLSKLMITKAKEGKFEEANAVKKISPVAWRHINFYGRYRFSSSKTGFDFDKFIAEVVKKPVSLSYDGKKSQKKRRFS